MKLKAYLKIFVTLLVFYGTCYADIYKWTDANGRVHFSDKAPVDVKVKQITPAINTYQNKEIRVDVYKPSTVYTNFSYYDVYLGGGKSLLSALNEATPIIQGGIKYHGFTKWNIKWRYKWSTVLGVCRIDSVNTDLEILYTMPRIGRQNTPIENYTKAFNAFYNSLMIHEKGHANIGLLAAKEIEKELLKSAPSSDCKIVEAAANRTASGIISAYRLKDNEYDRVTNHGKSQL